MDDVCIFEKKLYSLDVPMSRIEADTGFNMGRASEISRDELNFKSHQYFKISLICCLSMPSSATRFKGIVGQEEFYKISQDFRFDLSPTHSLLKAKSMKSSKR